MCIVETTNTRKKTYFSDEGGKKSPQGFRHREGGKNGRMSQQKTVLVQADAAEKLPGTGGIKRGVSTLGPS